MKGDVFFQNMQELTAKWKVEAEKWLYKRAKEILEEESSKSDTLKIIQEDMIEKDKQDELWKVLSEETKQEYREKYKFHLADSKREMKLIDGAYDLTVLRSHTIVDELVNMFGIHNLNPGSVKKEGWVNVYKDGCHLVGYKIYSTKEEAERAEGEHYITSVKIEWEEGESDG